MQEGGPECEMVIKQLPAIPVILDIRVSSESGRDVPCPRAEWATKTRLARRPEVVGEPRPATLLLPSFFCQARSCHHRVRAHGLLDQDDAFCIVLKPWIITLRGLHEMFYGIDMEDARGRTRSPCMCIAHEPQRHSRWPDPATPRSRTANYSSTKLKVIAQPGDLCRLINYGV
jgi:hypothetical protein